MKNSSGYKEISDKLIREISKTKKSYWVEIDGENYRVLPNVYSPKYFEDSQIFAKNLPILKDKKVLEIGCGTGVIAIRAAKMGASEVLAVDVNPDAVKNTKENVGLFKLGSRIKVLQSDIFSKINKNERFDAIIWNTPFTWVEEGEISNIEKSVYDPGYKSTRRFLREASSFLSTDGKVYVCFSSTVGRLDLLTQIVEEFGLDISMIRQMASNFDTNLKYEIFMIEPKR